MSLILDGTNGLSDVDGSAATPAIRGSDANTGVFFGTDIVGVSTGGSERMRVDASGNVGIGTSTFTFNNRLNIKQSTDTGASAFGLRVERQANDSLCFLGYRDNTNTWQLNATFSSTGAFAPITFHTSDAERARIDSSGNLLVGTTSGSDFKLRVNRSGNLGVATFTNSETSGLTYDQTQIIVGQAAGTGYMLARYYTSAGAAAQFAFRGDGQMFATATSISSISDARTKENVRESSDGLDTVLGLRAVRFDFKEGFSNNRKNQLGFIAQEVEAVFPDAVDVSGQFAEDESEYKTVAPGTLIPVLVKAIQEQQAIITALTARVEALEGAQA